MSCTSCENLQFGTFGTPDCSPINKVFVSLYIVPLIRSNGTERKFDSGDFATVALNALVNADDPRDRIYPMHEIENITGERAVAILEQMASGRVNHIRDGDRNFVFQADLKGADFVENVEKWRCIKFGIIGVDTDGTAIGRDKKDGFLYPIPVDNSSLAARIIDATHTTAIKVEVSWNYHRSMKDKEFGQINAESFTGKLLEKSGLFSVFSEISNISATGFDIVLKTAFGDADNKIKDKGRVTADFVSSDSLVASKIYNETADADIPVTVTDVDVDGGKYHVAYAAQTAGDKLVPYLKVDGRDYTPLKTNKVIAV